MKFKLIFYFIFGLLVNCLLVPSCKKFNHPNPLRPALVLMPQAADNPQTIVLPMSDTAQSIIYSAYYSGASNTNDIKVRFEADGPLVDSFNLKNNTHYTLLPPKSYTLEKTNAIIPKGKWATQPLHLNIKTIGYLKASIGYLLPLSVINTQANLKISKNLGTTYFIIQARYDTTMVFMARGGDDPVNLNVPLRSNKSQIITYNAKYGGSDPGTSLTVGFKVDTTLTKSFNLAHKTHYPSMPKGSYKMLQATGSIPKGEKETQQLKIKLNLVSSMTSMQLNNGFLLPVRITSLSGKNLASNKALIISKNKGVAFFLITDRSYIPLALNTTSDVSQMNIEKVGNGAYKFTTTGGDPNIYTQPLAKSVGDHKILAFEYKCSPEVNNFQIYFAPLAEPRSAHTGPLSATNTWTWRKIDLGQAYKDFSWGNAGDFLRLDFGQNSGVVIYVRNFRLEKE